MHLRVRAGLVAIAIAVACGVIAGNAQAAPDYPVVYNGAIGYGAHLLTPQQVPAGAQYVGWQAGTPAAAPCQSATHPYPVVLVDGTGANQDDDFSAVAPLLADNGYCVYTDNVGGPSAASPLQAIGPIPTSAAQLATVVDKVLAATGAAKVDLVGHSQGGGVLPRWYLRYDGGAAKVSQLVGLAPSNHGTTFDGLLNLVAAYHAVGVLNLGFNIIGIPAGAEQEVGSPVNTQLDQGGDTVPGVTYTTIVSRYDEVVTPYTNQFLTPGPGATAHNILLQNVCALDHGEHLSVVYDQIALRLMLNALDPPTAVTPACVPIAPIVGG